ncbi:uncharacterized protein N7484_008568 [Penicillium longicatenatum]|uniref:uncharacterized protein n=1 Tax=Penicillium longicatenatum TaxID=1561947 RepID=UPI002547EBB2|nr:uncharacterized protein N7484_008568 [Penicillium longicatenatum]KAJ5635255.1 hypothetical protein N7484_008568 [Penicillium longicatenatum]KAJ5655441.1 hypothetical protein N7507_007391 [Penicillium longicatenatum]
MTSKLFGYRLAQATGISGAAWLSGNIAALSTIATPALVQSQTDDHKSPSLLAKQWKALFDIGKRKNPPIAAAAATSLAYLAWSVRRGSPLYKATTYSRSGLYIAAAVLTVGIVPYTLILMDGTNHALLKKAQSTSDADKEVSALVERWNSLNLGRSIFPLAGALCAVVATIL